MAGRGIFRIWRRFRPLPGMSLNLSKTGVSASIGPRGAQYTVGPRGSRTTFGLPGTGFYWTSHHGRQGRAESPLPQPYTIASIFTPSHVKKTVKGLEAVAGGDDRLALDYLNKAPHSADANYLAGYIHLAHDNGEPALEHFTRARSCGSLGQTFEEYGLDASLTYSLGYDVKVRIHPDHTGLAIGLAESYVLTGQHGAACAVLQDACEADDLDRISRVFLARLLWYRPDRNPEHLNEILTLAAAIDNETALETYLLLYRARALRGLDLLAGSLETSRTAIRRRKNRPLILLSALKVETALALEASDQVKKARALLETVYGESPDFPGIRNMLEMHRGEPMA